MTSPTHPLDNPVWNAMLSGNRHLAAGDEHIRFFTEGISPFVGVPEPGPRALEELYRRVPAQKIVAVVTAGYQEVPPLWSILERDTLLQMIGTGLKPLKPHTSAIIPLDHSHVPQMIALTALTKPGPFDRRTIELGDYAGIFDQNHLIAMAGRRFHVHDFIEVSAVCTHPHHTGRGYGSTLLLDRAHRIKAVQGTPYLHVRTSNPAIRLYEALGFRTRSTMNLLVLQKPKDP